mmetsp:Transcript_17474/g.35923  ORF Transcript_17474/g.35923 Transcript_17474/m.35923 type:complete len:88 (+) Transcript_17474:1363-1626(+)
MQLMVPSNHYFRNPNLMQRLRLKEGNKLKENRFKSGNSLCRMKRRDSNSVNAITRNCKKLHCQKSLVFGISDLSLHAHPLTSCLLSC